MNGIKIISYLISLLIALFISIPSVQAHYLSYGKNGRQHCGVYASAEAFYARADDGFLNSVAYAIARPQFFLTPTLDVITTPSDYDYFYNRFDNRWGYQLVLGYDFPSCDPCCSIGASLEYTHHNSGNTAETPFAVFPDGTIIGVFGGPPVDVSGEPSPTFFSPFISANTKSLLSVLGATGVTDPAFSHILSRVESQYDVIDLLAHVNRRLCRCVDAQFFAGARYVNFEEKIDVNSSFTPGPGGLTLAAADTLPFPLNDDVRIRNNTDAFGPRVGTSVFIPVFCGFGIVTEASGSLLYGSERSHYDEAFTIVDPIARTFTTHNHETHNRAIPELAGKAALAISFDFRNCSSLTIEAGYRVDKYFFLVNQTAALSSTILENTYITSKESEFDLGGPYVTVTWHM